MLEALMKHMSKVMTVALGDLIAALYDETEKTISDKRLQTLIVALALLDLRRRAIRSPKIAQESPKKVA
jgi:hypothetical protein